MGRAKGFGESFDVSPDGKRFVTIQSDTSEDASTPLTFVLNFFDELRRRAVDDH
jgi:hypothetical protein